MKNHFYYSLKQWQELKLDHQWVLGAVVRTRGSVYRKTGALMLLSDAGHQLGLLSGGCLESDLLVQARKACALNKSRIVIYDAEDEEGLAWRLGIGCGGASEIALLPCNDYNDFLQLDFVAQNLSQGKACEYHLDLSAQSARVRITDKNFSLRTSGALNPDNAQELKTVINPIPHLVVLGAGIDVIPICQLANNLGWQVTVIDDKLSPQKQAGFPGDCHFINGPASQIPAELLAKADGAIIANHNMEKDALSLDALLSSAVKYIGLLGPQKRKQHIMQLAKLTDADLPVPVAGPMGLALGGELPEDIALSVLAECHAVIFGAKGTPLNSSYL